jgi:predicted nucleic-acid-binding Zn-ribbon protein
MFYKMLQLQEPGKKTSTIIASQYKSFLHLQEKNKGYEIFYVLNN